MASNTSSSTALFLAVNLLFFAVATSTDINPSLNPKAPELVSSSLHKKCPIHAVKLGVCANVLNGLINLNLGKPPKKPCCPLLHGLVDLEAAVCLCTALKAEILGIKLNLPIDLNLVLNYCGKKSPKGFKCA